MGKILVVGSMNMDMVFKTDRYPEKGETIIGREFQLVPGGKGGNQASAIGKLGGNVSFISACGHDYYGNILLKSLKENGVDVKNISRIGDTTGVAAITIEGDGDNRIIVIPGANGKITPEIIDEYRKDIQEARVVLLQMEIPLETVLHTIELAYHFKTEVILDPAPAQPLPEEMYRKISYILPNEGELNQLTAGFNLTTREERVKKLLESGVGAVLVTAGENGIFYYTGDGQKHYPAIKVDVVDTTAAGDAFAGAFAFGLQQGWSIDRAIKYANVVGGLTVTRLGAQSSLPSREEVTDFIRRRNINEMDY